MRLAILYALTAIAAFGQIQTPARVFQSSGSISGEIWQQEPRSGGQNWFKRIIPVLAGDVTITEVNALPATNGECIKGTTAGVLSFGSCGVTEFLVTDYGALCDGTTDDTTAIQAAIAASETAVRGRVVLPSGVCITTGVTIDNSYQGMRGQGRDVSILKSTTNAPVITVDTNVGALYYLEFSGFTVEGNAAGTSQIGINVSGSGGLSVSGIHDMRFESIYRGVKVATTANSAYLRVSGNVFASAFYGIERDVGGSGWTITDNQISSKAGGTGLYIHGNIGDMIASNNHIEEGAVGIEFYCDDAAGACSYGQRLVVNNNKIDGTTSLPIKAHQVEASSFIGNRVGGGVEPVTFTGRKVGNIYDASQNRGLEFSNSDGDLMLNHISGGRIRTGTTSGNLSFTPNGISLFDQSATVAIGIGQSGTANVGLLWNYNATPANAYAALYTFGYSNPLYLQASELNLHTGGSTRWQVTSTGMLVPLTDDAYDFGTDTVMANTVYSHGFRGIVNATDHVATRKLEIHGDATGTLFDYFSKPTTTSIDLRNTAGALVMRWDSTGISANGVSTQYQLWPGGTSGLLPLGLPDSRWSMVNSVGGSFSANATAVTPPSGTLLHVVGANATLPRFVVDAFAAIPAMNFRRSNGTAAAPSALAANDILLNLTALGYGTSAYSTGGRVGILGYAAEAWTNTAHGTYFTFGTTPNGSTTYTDRWKIDQDGAFLPLSAIPIGASGSRVSKIWVTDIDASGTCTGCSGSVAAPLSLSQDLATYSETGAHLILRGTTDSNKILALGYNTTANVGFIQSVQFGTAATPLALQPNGGATTVGGTLSVTGGNSLLMDRATRGTNQKAYWTVAGSPATTGAWSTGTTPGGGQSRWVIEHNGTEHVTVDESGLVSLSAGLGVTGAASAANFNGTGSNPFRVSGTGVIDASRNASFVNLTLSGSVASDLIPSIANTWLVGTASFPYLTAHISTVTAYTGVNPDLDGGADLGTSSLRFANSHFNTVRIYATLVPDATSGTLNFGSTSLLWGKVFTKDIRIDGVTTWPSGSTGYSGTISVRKGDDSGACNLVYSGGGLTSHTC